MWKCENKQTNKQTDRQTDKQTNKQKQNNRIFSSCSGNEEFLEPLKD